MDIFSRTELLLGPDAMEKLNKSHIAIFGIGGVGSYAAEAVARSGLGNITLVDSDRVCPSNINRQLIANKKTIGMLKVSVMRDRILEINPEANVEAIEAFYDADNAGDFDYSKFDYIIDAIDTVSSKITLIENAKAKNVPIISCMGAGNKLDPTLFELEDIYKTSVCPLAKVMRYELRKRGIDSLKVVYSKEKAIKPLVARDDIGVLDETNKGQDQAGAQNTKRQIPGSISFVPPVAGLILGGEAIRDILGIKRNKKK